MRILVVEDHAEMAGLICEVLRDAYYAVDHASSGVEACELMEIETYDLAVIDWHIPPPSGLDLVRRWRSQERSIPLLMLTVRDGVEDMVGALDAGADDYLTKPFAFEVFLARVRSLIRRRELRIVTALRAGDVRMDRSKKILEVAGKPVKATPKEFAMLEYLMLRQDEVVSRTELGEHVWDSAFDPITNVIDVTIHRLRKKIDRGQESCLLQTVRGAGYMLRSERE